MDAFAFLDLSDSVATNVVRINQDDQEDTSEMQGKIDVNHKNENLKQSSSEA